MTDEVILTLEATDLPGMAQEVGSHELRRTLKDLRSDSGKNYAIYRKSATPGGDIAILPAPSVPPAGGKKLCDGKLKVGANVLDVTAYRVG